MFPSGRVLFSQGNEFDHRLQKIDIVKCESAKTQGINGSTNKLDQTASDINFDLLRYYSKIQD